MPGERVGDAGGPVSAAALVAQGITSIGRYVARDGDWRRFTRVERDDLFGHGISAWLIREGYTGQEALGGYQVGLTEGRIAAEQGEWLDWPTHRPAYFPADFRIAQADYGRSGDTLHGFADGLDSRLQVGTYGGSRWVKWTQDQGLSAFQWVSGATWWDDGVLPNLAEAEIHQFATQILNGSVDLGETFAVDWGAWHPDKQEGPVMPEDIATQFAVLAQLIDLRLIKTEAIIRGNPGDPAYALQTLAEDGYRRGDQLTSISDAVRALGDTTKETVASPPISSEPVQ